MKSFLLFAISIAFLFDITKSEGIEVQLTRVEEPLSLHSNFYPQQISIQESVKIDLQNVRDIQYMGELYIGSSGQKLNFVFDTGSVWTWIPLSECHSCSQIGMELFEETESETYKRLQDSVQTVKYGQSSAYGYFSKERVCLKEKPIQQSSLPTSVQLQDS